MIFITESSIVTQFIRKVMENSWKFILRKNIAVQFSLKEKCVMVFFVLIERDCTIKIETRNVFGKRTKWNRII